MTTQTDSSLVSMLKKCGMTEQDRNAIIAVVMKEKSLSERQGAEEERRFILNVLDGIDTADEAMGVLGGTKAIRFALQSRALPITQQAEGEPGEIKKL